MDTFTFNIPKDLKFDFKLIALKERSNMADITRELIEAYVRDYKQNNI